MTRSPIRSTSVLHIGKYYWPHLGGIESYHRDLVQRQSGELDIQVLVANDAARFEVQRLDGAIIARAARFGTIASMPITPALPWHIARRKADIVHIHLPNPWAALALLLSGHKGKVVITHHGDTLGRESLRKISDPFVVMLMRRASAIIVSSARYLQSSEELADFRDKCQVVPLGLDFSKFDKVDEKTVSRLRDKHGDRFILSVGRLVPYKGVRYLIESMRRVDAQLVHIGTGPLAPELLQRAADAGLSSKVHLLGRVDDLAPYLHAASMLVLPSISRAESFGIVQLEAMAAGLPIINTDLESGVPEVSLHGVTGLTVPPADTVSLAAAINLLLDDAGFRKRLGEAGKLRVQREFSLDRMATDTMRIYESVLPRATAETRASLFGQVARGHKFYPVPVPPLTLSPTIKTARGSRWCVSGTKRLMDVVGAAVALVLLSPLLLFVASLVALSSKGPVMFAQRRVGRLGRLFTIYKFRTMHAAPHRRGPIVTKCGDSRITRVGRMLRRFKIDELPQFYNVLRGDMSLVGPRPKLPQHEEMNMPFRPGMTGAATLTFRFEEEMLRHIPETELDYYYACTMKPLKAQIDWHYMENATLVSDLSMILRTAVACARRRPWPEAPIQPLRSGTGEAEVIESEQGVRRSGRPC